MFLIFCFKVRNIKIQNTKQPRSNLAKRVNYGKGEGTPRANIANKANKGTSTLP